MVLPFSPFSVIINIQIFRGDNMKKLISLSLSAVLLLTTLFSFSIAYADAYFECGENAIAHYTDAANKLTPNTLTISGTGAMYDYSTTELPLWQNQSGADGYTIYSLVVEPGITHIGNSAFESITQIKTVSLPDTITTIGDRAFWDCEGITGIDIPASVTSIGKNALTMSNNSQSGKLKAINVAEDNANYCSVNGILYSKDMTTLIQAPSKYAETVITVPNTVKIIAPRAFQSLKSVTEIIVPETVTEIGEYAFNNCKALKNITFLGAGSISIDDTAFDNVSGTTVHGYAGSSANDLAVAKGFEFIAFPEEEPPVEPPQEIHTHTYVTKTAVTKAATQSNDGIITTTTYCSGCDDAKSTTTKIPRVSTITLQKTTFGYNWYYTGKVITPKITVKDSTGKALVNGTDYTLSYASGRKNIGRYTIKVNLKGKYSGSKAFTFDIVARPTSITRLDSRAKGFTVGWKKNTNQTKGYQIQYSTAANMSGAKTITVAKNNNYAKAVKGLAKNKKYYVRVRVYSRVKYNGKYVNLYSPWTKTKAVKTK